MIDKDPNSGQVHLQDQHQNSIVVLAVSGHTAAVVVHEDRFAEEKDMVFDQDALAVGDNSAAVAMELDQAVVALALDDIHLPYLHHLPYLGVGMDIHLVALEGVFAAFHR